MNSAAARRRFLELWREIRGLQTARLVLEWDQETYMPAAGSVARGETLAALAGLEHTLLTAPELSAVVEASIGDGEAPEWLAQAREARRQMERSSRIPRRLAGEIAAATSHALTRWVEARRQREFALFEPALGVLVRLVRERAQALAREGSPYDALLDEFEPGATERSLVPLFDQLRARLVPWVSQVADAPAVDEAPLRGSFPLTEQRALAQELVGWIGFDFGAGRLDDSVHPFCLGIDPGDVRLTWRGDPTDLRPGMLGALHEAGHGLYEQALPAQWRGTPLGEAASTGIHESQARLWENQVGRRASFWRWLLPRLRRAFPTWDTTVDTLWPALQSVRPSLIRVEADPATYHLHILVRFELERALVSGDLEVQDLPGAWAELYQAYLGVSPNDDAEGALQDLHWAAGLFGYFPTYTLGTLASVQLFAAAEAELGGLDRSFAAGELAPLREWLRRTVHRRGRLLEPQQLLTEVTGRGYEPGPFLDQLEATAREVYGITLPG